MTDRTGHLDLDALADVLAGERADAHLRTCLPCAQRLSELAAADASVTAVLGALPAPALPDGLAARLARALQDEQAQDEPRPAPAVGGPLRRRPLPWLPAAAASVAVVLAGALGWSVLDRWGTSSDDAVHSAGGGQQDSSSTAPEAAAGLALPRLDTGTDWSDEAARGPAVARLLGASDPPANGSTAVPSGGGLDRLRDPAALAACLSALPGGDDDVLAVDYARYAGAPAVAVVQAAGADRVRVTVVGSGCSATDPEVLTEASSPRP